MNENECELVPWVRAGDLVDARQKEVPSHAALQPAFRAEFQSTYRLKVFCAFLLSGSIFQVKYARVLSGLMILDLRILVKVLFEE